MTAHVYLDDPNILSVTCFTRFRAFFRILLVRPSVKIFCTLIGLGLIGLGISSPWVDRAPGMVPAVIMLAVGMGNVILGIYLIVAPRKLRLVLYENAIEKTDVLRTRRLNKDEIAYKLVVVNFVSNLVLIPRDRKTNKKMMVELCDYIQDDAFKRWMDSIPDWQKWKTTGAGGSKAD